MNENRNKVAVLMSTYNGEKYLEEQLESIFAQKDVDLTLFVRDDGSKDNTLNIIDKYRKKYSNIILVDSKENLGPAMSFMILLKYAYLNNKFDYFAFSDQDDIWLSNKLIKGIKNLKDNNEPYLYCSNQILYINDEKKGFRFTEELPIDLGSYMVKNEISGCTMIMNRKLVSILKILGFPETNILNYRLHDTWVLLVACIYGKVIYDKESEILYRIHENNCIGIKKNSFWQRIKRRYFNKTPAKNLRSKTAKELLKRCEFKSLEDKELVQSFANYQNSLFDKKKLLKLSDSICKKSGESKISLYMKILLNIF